MPWFDDAPVRKDTLNNVMKKLSVDSKLSKIYTNHCIRHAVVNTLDNNNFKACHIMAHTGHKSESRIRAYATKCPVNKFQEMSECLANTLAKDAPPAKKKPTSTASVPTEDPSVVKALDNAMVQQENVNPNPQNQLNSNLDHLTDDNLLQILSDIKQ